MSSSSFRQLILLSFSFLWNTIRLRKVRVGASRKRTWSTLSSRLANTKMQNAYDWFWTISPLEQNLTNVKDLTATAGSAIKNPILYFLETSSTCYVKYWLESQSKATDFHGVFKLYAITKKLNPSPIFFVKPFVVVSIKCGPLSKESKKLNWHFHRLDSMAICLTVTAIS